MAQVAGSRDLVFAYDNVDGPISNVTIGAENPTGEAGTALVNSGDASGVIANDALVCMTYDDTLDAQEFTYQVSVDDGVTDGQVLSNSLEHVTDNPGAEPVTVSRDVTVESGADPDPDPDPEPEPDPGAVDTTTTATADPVTYGTPGRVEVQVSSTEVTTGTVTATSGDTELGTASVVSDGSATIPISGTALAPGSYPVTVTYAGDADNAPSSGAVELVVEKAAPSVDVTVAPSQVGTGEQATLSAEVTAEGFSPGGTVEFFVDDESVGSEELEAGAASLQVGPFSTAGSRAVRAEYAGDPNTEAGTDEATLAVVEADPGPGPEPELLPARIKIDTKPGKIKEDKTRAKLVVVVKADGVTPTGTVRIRVSGKGTRVVELNRNGKAKLRLPEFGKPGKKKVRVRYNGSDAVEREKEKYSFRVVR